ncbi:5-formyltetrahydrofolate cyclo-ligase [Pontibacillus litoralis]|uniref:5-formyltetrahydrofolate cyclo-ligase n=1 Tax=Pontibacillus litoralis JSM 072002 TaxID=1385512 RepID=A0A0A5GCN5_9BACI|nr:5-formyltetrahydrofolate cyclo-ligase [Pontibacillus litoralis]KGX88880.1 hypothetical protein N784_00615 [Pontibacillus litoralis JSM 072002]
MKQELRNYGKCVMSDITDEQTASIHCTLMETSLWREANVIGCTISQAHEINTRPIIERAWKEGKKVVVPKCYPKERQLIFYKITSFDELESVYFGLKEPIIEQTTEWSKEHIDLMIVPGLMFDVKGYRVGYGGGYYDRYLVGYNGATVSLCTEHQLIEQVPFDSYDIPVQHLITESGLQF